MARGEPRPAAATAFGAEIQGQRAEQEDSFRLRRFSEDSSWLIVLSDGMGGHACGALASRIAADGFLASFIGLKSRNVPLDEALGEALRESNDRIARAREAAPEVGVMGTTLVAAYLASDGVSWVSVGDSPLWLYRGGKLVRLNEDHSLRGVAGEHARGNANMLCSALDGEQLSLVDFHPEPEWVGPDELVIAASDGILTLSDDEIAAQLKSRGKTGVEGATMRVLAAVDAAQRRHQDNCTVIVAAPAPVKRLGLGARLFNGAMKRLRGRNGM
jgi:serine/threonine protein phosphatase PrpC